MRKRFVLVLSFIGIFSSAIANAQAPDKADAKADAGAAPDAASGPKRYDCDPICRPGHQCVEGKCVSLCNPPCAADEVCQGLGKCLPAPVCEPQCRGGYTCLNGKCISACNPACKGGEVCTEGGQCVVPTYNESTTVWVWRDRPPHWYWVTPRPYWWWTPHRWHPAPRHYPRGDRPRHRRHR
jgi:hypothetical protein